MDSLLLDGPGAAASPAGAIVAAASPAGAFVDAIFGAGPDAVLGAGPSVVRHVLYARVVVQSIDQLVWLVRLEHEFGVR